MAKDLFGQEATRPTGTDLRLVSLKLRNFMGLREFDLELDGRNASILADNGLGKTTLFTAFAWVLFGVDADGRKDFDIKTLTPEGEPIHGLEHTVEAVLSVDGVQLVLRKTYREVWTKARGSAEKTFTGHTTDYVIDGVPTTQRDYEGRIAKIIDAKRFKLLTSCTYFNEQLHWQERRKLLLEVCGDCPDSEVIASDPRLSELRGILGSRSLDDHRKVIAAQRSKINKELEQIPVRISEVQRNLPDVEGLDKDAAAANLTTARTALQKKNEELALIENGGEAAQKKQHLAEVGAKLLDTETKHRRQADQAYSASLRMIEDARAKVTAAERELQTHRNNLTDAEDRAGQLEGRLHELRKAFRAATDEEFTHSADTVCPTCGQALPEDQVEEARAKALEQFNLSKSQRIERINADGKELKAVKERADAAAEEARKRAAQLEESLPALRKATLDAQADANRLVTASENSSAIKDPDYIKLAAERDKLAAEIERLKTGGAAQTEGIREEILDLQKTITGAERVVSMAVLHDSGTARIEELKADEKRLAAEFEDLERQLYLTEEFLRTKVRLLEDRINSRFELARFRLFEVQVNGALAETCQAMYNGVPYDSLNSGARINLGLDLIRTLSQHFRFSAPVWIDGKESVTKLIDMPCQMICLVVSESDKSLRVEVA